MSISAPFLLVHPLPVSNFIPRVVLQRSPLNVNHQPKSKSLFQVFSFALHLFALPLHCLGRSASTFHRLLAPGSYTLVADASLR